MYELFRALPPYNRWKLPPPEKVQFAVNSIRKEYGRYESEPPRISVSRRNVKSFHALAITVAHEVIHLRQDLTKTYSDRSQHNRAFVRTAKHVCRALGFDSTGFV
jgi:hypothetical protein